MQIFFLCPRVLIYETSAHVCCCCCCPMKNFPHCRVYYLHNYVFNKFRGSQVLSNWWCESVSYIYQVLLLPLLSRLPDMPSPIVFLECFAWIAVKQSINFLRGTSSRFILTSSLDEGVCILLSGKPKTPPHTVATQQALCNCWTCLLSF